MADVFLLTGLKGTMLLIVYLAIACATATKVSCLGLSNRRNIMQKNTQIDLYAHQQLLHRMHRKAIQRSSSEMKELAAGVCSVTRSF